jgi:hypothetical protein
MFISSSQIHLTTIFFFWCLVWRGYFTCELSVAPFAKAAMSTLLTMDVRMAWGLVQFCFFSIALACQHE